MEQIKRRKLPARLAKKDTNYCDIEKKQYNNSNKEKNKTLPLCSTPNNHGKHLLSKSLDTKKFENMSEDANLFEDVVIKGTENKKSNENDHNSQLEKNLYINAQSMNLFEKFPKTSSGNKTSSSSSIMTYGNVKINDKCILISNDDFQKLLANQSTSHHTPTIVIRKTGQENRIISKPQIINAASQSGQSSSISLLSKSSLPLATYDPKSSLDLVQNLMNQQKFNEHIKNYSRQRDCLNGLLKAIINGEKSEKTLNLLLKQIRDTLQINSIVPPLDNFHPLFIFDLENIPIFYCIGMHPSMNSIEYLPYADFECLRISRIIYTLVYEHSKNN